MYFILLFIHSWFRWLVLLSLIFALYRAYRGWLSGRPFSRFDNTVRHTTATIAHIQLLLGLALYGISPLVDYFLHHFKSAVQDRQIRFFGMEHSTVMIIAIIVITIGSARAKRRPADKQKFKTMAIWFTVGFILILSSVPWQFSPLVSRPFFRTF